MRATPQLIERHTNPLDDTLFYKASFDTEDIRKSAERVMKNHDHILVSHARDVERYSLDLARELGFSSENQEIIQLIGYLHDIGKIESYHWDNGNLYNVFMKSGNLNSEEWETAREHARLGMRILDSYNLPEIITHSVAASHDYKISDDPNMGPYRSGKDRRIIDGEKPGIVKPSKNTEYVCFERRLGKRRIPQDPMVRTYSQIVSIADVFSSLGEKRGRYEKPIKDTDNALGETFSSLNVDPEYKDAFSKMIRRAI